MMTTRLRTHGERLSDFGGECLVVCASRLPAWMQSARNRDDVLRCIRGLKERVG